MSEFLCKNCGGSMAYTRKKVWRHYDDTGCNKPEPDEEDSLIMEDREDLGEKA